MVKTWAGMEVGHGHPVGEADLGCNCPDSVTGLVVSVLVFRG